LLVLMLAHDTVGKIILGAVIFDLGRGFSTGAMPNLVAALVFVTLVIGAIFLRARDGDAAEKPAAAAAQESALPV
jgi:hypothetical protein